MVFGTVLICSLQPAFFGLVCIKKKTSVLEMKYTFNKRRLVISVTKKKAFFLLISQTISLVIKNMILHEDV